LLNRLLQEIGLSREDVYIANVLKCRPPNNRDPAQDEVDSCKDYLRAQITIIDPDVVVTLGNFATKLLMRTETGITRLRGRTYPWWQGRTLVPTYHPAAALRSGDRLIGEMQSDFALVRDALSRPRSNTVTPPPSGKGASPEAPTNKQSDGSRPDSEDPAEQMNLFA
jgi:DNA polymerase